MLVKDNVHMVHAIGRGKEFSLSFKRVNECIVFVTLKLLENT